MSESISTRMGQMARVNWAGHVSHLDPRAPIESKKHNSNQRAMKKGEEAHIGVDCQPGKRDPNPFTSSINRSSF